MSVSEVDHDEVVAEWYCNFYECSECGTTWEDEWSCTCNDHCPGCNREIEPTSSEDLSRPLTKEDYRGAARLTPGKTNRDPSKVTSAEAKEYAEAMLEGGERRFLERLAGG